MTTTLCIAAVLMLNLAACVLLLARERLGHRRRADLLAQVVQDPRRFGAVWSDGAAPAGDARLFVQDLGGRWEMLADALEYDAALERLRAAGVGVHEPAVARSTPAQQWATDPRGPSQADYWVPAVHTLPVRDGVAVLEPEYRRAMFAATPEAAARRATGAAAEATEPVARLALPA